MNYLIRSNQIQPNDCLGEFIDMVRKSSFGENTIIAITGDHGISREGCVMVKDNNVDLN